MGVFMTVFVVMLVVLGPLALRNTLRRISSQGDGTRRFNAGRDCHYCGGWGEINGSMRLMQNP
jgi:hypothetical protein